jgi:lipid A 3-O-deacylase
VAQESPPVLSPAVTLRFDNDVLARTDRGYTGGLTFGWDSRMYDDLDSHSWISWLPVAKGPDVSASLSFTLGIKVYTPDSIQFSEPIEGDRPYAGILYMTMGVPVRSPKHQDFFELTLGLVGPASQAQFSQSILHHIAPSNDPQGWGNQLGNEPLFEVTYEHKWKALTFQDAEGYYLQLIPHVGAGLGNLSIFAGVGGQVRLGWNLPTDFGVEMLRPAGFRSSSPNGGGGFGFELVLAADRKAVARNLLLDGNTFGTSLSVEKEPITSYYLIGGNLNLWRFSLGYEHIFWTRQFKTEPQNQTFSSFSLRYYY